jgi:hypothetical protein
MVVETWWDMASWKFSFWRRWTCRRYRSEIFYFNDIKDL